MQHLHSIFGAGYLYLKVFHLIMIISWFAGLFYLPRIFVNLAMETPKGPAYPRLLVMANKLYRFTFLLSHITLLSGILMWVSIGHVGGWMHAKALLVFGLFMYQYSCKRILRGFERNENQRTHVWFRWFNEVPIVVLLCIITLAILKPF